MRHLITYKQLINWGYKKLCTPANLGNLEVYPELKMNLIKCVCGNTETVGELIIPGKSTKEYRNEPWKIFKGCTPSLDILRKFHEMYAPIVTFRQETYANFLNIYLSEDDVGFEQILLAAKDSDQDFGIIKNRYCKGEWRYDRKQYIPGEMKDIPDDPFWYDETFFQYINIRHVRELGENSSTIVSYC